MPTFEQAAELAILAELPPAKTAEEVRLDSFTRREAQIAS